EGRSLLSRGSADKQTSQSQPMIGTPCEVPVPKKVILILIVVDLSFQFLPATSPHHHITTSSHQHISTLSHQSTSSSLLFFTAFKNLALFSLSEAASTS